MKRPCAAHLDTAKELLEHGLIGEGAKALVDLRRCAGDCGCEDWQDCDATIQDAWREVTHKPLPEARPGQRAAIRAKRLPGSVLHAGTRRTGAGGRSPPLRVATDRRLR